MLRDLNRLFEPQSVAIIGASPVKEKVGGIVLSNMRESTYGGKIYPINPKYNDINGLPCYPNLEAVKERIDLALVAIPAVGVLEVMESLGNYGVKNVIIYSAGFKESGSEGEEAEEELKKIIEKYQINLIGPNCLGMVNTYSPLNATFGKVTIKHGNLRFVSQSGALATSLFDWFGAIGLGFGDFITLGNKAGLNENDLLEYWLQNEKIAGDPIGLYLESISDGIRFKALCKQLSQRQPVFLLKPGKSKAAAHAMKSHTGSIAGEDSTLAAAVAEAGIIRCEELEDFFDYSRAFAWSRIPQGPRVAIVSNAGGPAVLTTDALETEGLKLATFSKKTSDTLAECLPRTASLFNPVDILGDALADRFNKATEIVLQEDTVDAVLVILTPQLMTQISQTATMIGALSKKYQKTVFCSFIGGGYTSEGERILNSLEIPTFRFPERAIKTLAALYRWQQWKNNKENFVELREITEKVNPEVENLIKAAVTENRESLSPLESEKVLQGLGAKVPISRGVTTLQEAENFIQEKGWPVVLKLSSDKILHKSDVGGVKVHLTTLNELSTAWDELQTTITKLQSSIEGPIGIQIQQEIPRKDSVEVIIGAKRDPTFGAVMLFGAGGVMTELIADRNLALLPVVQKSAEKLIKSSKVFTLLNGFRGGPVYSIEGLIKLMMTMSNMMEKLPEITDMEINPVIVTPTEIWSVDGKVLLKKG